MPTCPHHHQTDRLGRLLADDLPGDEQARHGSSRTMPGLSPGARRPAVQSGLWKHLPLLRDDDLDPPTQDLVQAPGVVHDQDEEIPLGLLEVVDQPGLLGGWARMTSCASSAWAAWASSFRHAILRSTAWWQSRS